MSSMNQTSMIVFNFFPDNAIQQFSNQKTFLIFQIHLWLQIVQCWKQITGSVLRSLYKIGKEMFFTHLLNHRRHCQLMARHWPLVAWNDCRTKFEKRKTLFILEFHLPSCRYKVIIWTVVAVKQVTRPHATLGPSPAKPLGPTTPSPGPSFLIPGAPPPPPCPLSPLRKPPQTDGNFPLRFLRNHPRWFLCPFWNLAFVMPNVDKNSW